MKLRRRAELVLDADADPRPIDVRLEDLSFGGAGLITGIALTPGACVTLLLQSNPPRSLRGHVLNCNPAGENQFRVSVHFDVASGRAIDQIRYAFFPG